MVHTQYYERFDRYSTILQRIKAFDMKKLELIVVHRINEEKYNCITSYSDIDIRSHFTRFQPSLVMFEDLFSNTIFAPHLQTT